MKSDASWESTVPPHMKAWTGADIPDALVASVVRSSAVQAAASASTRGQVAFGEEPSDFACALNELAAGE